MPLLDEFFESVRRDVDLALEHLIPSGPPARLYDAVCWSVFAGGKRFRPALVLAVGEAFGAKRPELLRTAAAVEMIHTYSLIHDDLPAMDDDDLRRGRATCHIKFDEATAILAGDVLQSLAIKAIANDPGLPESVRLRLVSELADAAARMVDGQQLDLDAEGRKITLQELEQIHRNKTGAMICVSARAGAIIGEADEERLEAVSKYATALGLLFQITDDLLDVTQTTEVLGKTAGKDQKAEKATYPSFHGIEVAQRLADRTYAEALNALEPLGRRATLLREIAEYILNRRS